jgi:hypothetical protein
MADTEYPTAAAALVMVPKCATWARRKTRSALAIPIMM